jgi:hypothetical protein
MSNATAAKNLQKNFVNIQVWINTPETNRAKKDQGTANPNYGCIEVWFNRNPDTLYWSPTVKLTLGRDKPIRHNNETADQTEAVGWLNNLLAGMVEQYEELQGYCGDAATSDGPYTVVMKVRAGTKPASNSQETFHDRNKMIVHLRSTLGNLSRMYQEMRGELPQPTEDDSNVADTFDDAPEAVEVAATV